MYHLPSFVKNIVSKSIQRQLMPIMGVKGGIEEQLIVPTENFEVCELDFC